MEGCRKIFIEPNGTNVLIPRTPYMKLKYPKGSTLVGVGFPQVYKRRKSFEEQFSH
jgi:hypothetical protein